MVGMATTPKLPFVWGWWSTIKFWVCHISSNILKHRDCSDCTCPKVTDVDSYLWSMVSILSKEVVERQVPMARVLGHCRESLKQVEKVEYLQICRVQTMSISSFHLEWSMLTPKKHTEMKAPHPLKCPPLSPILRYLLQKAMYASLFIHVFKPVADILLAVQSLTDPPQIHPSHTTGPWHQPHGYVMVRLSSRTQQSVDPEFSPQNSHMDYFGWGMLGSIVYWCLLFSNIAVSSCTYGHSFHSWPLPERIFDVNWSDLGGLKVENVESQGATLKRPATHSWTSLQVPSSVQMCIVCVQ